MLVRKLEHVLPADNPSSLFILAGLRVSRLTKCGKTCAVYDWALAITSIRFDLQNTIIRQITEVILTKAMMSNRSMFENCIAELISLLARGTLLNANILL
jgi:hypothetical protein